MKRRFRWLAALTAALLSLTALPLQTSAAEDEDLSELEDWEDWDDENEPTGELLAGDVNDDGEVSVIDVIILQGWLLGHDNVELLAPWNADTNGDGEVDIFDLSFSKRIVIGNGKTTFPIEPGEPTEPTEPTDPTPPPTEPTEPTTPVPVNGGSVYKRIALTDQQAGVVAYEGIIPEGWTAQIQSNWMNINHYAGQENVIFTSPDGKAAVQIASPQAYTQSNTRDEGIVISEFSHYLHYMNAEQYIEAYVQSNYPDAAFLKNGEIPENQKQAISDFAAQQGQYFVLDGQAFGFGMSLVGTEGTIARRQYQNGTEYAEYYCAIPAFEYTYQITAMFPIDNIEWTTLNTVAFVAADREAFDKYYSDYEMIAANGYFTAAFFSANTYVMNKLAEMMLDAKKETSGYDWAGTYSSSGIEVNSSDMDTQDRVMQAWDDVIKEQDRYKTDEGNTIITSMFNETVAQDGDRFYVGNRTGIPDGFTELPKITPANP